jgi:nucleoside-diphosphate-sugar epimerase
MKDLPSKGPFLVTGASGFLGSYLVKELLKHDVSVRAMVRSSSSRANLEGLDVEIVEGDLQNKESLLKATEGIQGVFHIAALFRQAGIPDEQYGKVNAEGTRLLLDASIEQGVKRFIHCSTVGVLSHIDSPPANESTPYKPGDIYQYTKMQGELIALDYFKSGKIPGVVIRPAMIYGPGDSRTLKLFNMISRGIFFYVGKGKALVHWVDVRDLAHAFWLAMQKTELNNAIYTIGGERFLPLKDMTSIVAQRLNVRKPWLHLPVKPTQLLGTLCERICTPLKIQPPIYRRRVDFFTKDRAFDISKAKSELGFKPSQSLEGEITDIIESYRAANLIKVNSSSSKYHKKVVTRLSRRLGFETDRS